MMRPTLACASGFALFSQFSGHVVPLGETVILSERDFWLQMSRLENSRLY